MRTPKLHTVTIVLWVNAAVLNLEGFIQLYIVDKIVVAFGGDPLLTPGVFLLSTMHKIITSIILFILGIVIEVVIWLMRRSS